MKKNLLRPHLYWQNLKFCVTRITHHGDSDPHWHDDFYELVFVFKGKGIHFIDGITYPVSTGNVFLILPGVSHSYRNAQAMGIYNILFSKSFLRHFQQDMLGYPNFQLLFNLLEGPSISGKTLKERDVLRLPNELFPEMIRLLDDIILEQNTAEHGGQTAILSDALRIILLICRHGILESHEKPVSHAYRISSIKAALDSRFGEPWSLEKMAEFAHMPEGSFRLQFKQMTGFSPVAYLLDLRLKRAAALLALPDRTIGEVSTLCGFEDSNYFSRQFHKMFQASPREYRLRNSVR